ncbi:MAG: cytochrome P450 [Proteobacteria bacterium]|nr:cytochrome P450 [Pseudomonadota bacterium]
MDAPLPPGPRGDFFLGSTLDFKEQPLHYIKYLHEAYGDVVRFRVGPSYWYLVTHPDDIWDIMTRRADVFLKPQIAKRLWEKFLGDGLLTTEGATWKRQHKLVLPAFHRKRIMAYGDTMVAYTHRMVDEWQSDERRDFDDDMVQLTLEIVAKTLFDADVREGAEKVGEAMHVIQKEMVEHIHMPVPVPKWWPSKRNKRKLKAIDDMESVVRGVIDSRRGNTADRGDLLSMLLMSKDEDGNGLSDKEVRDQSMTLFFAGHETTAHAMTWMWYLLARNPDVTERLVADIDRVTGGERLTVAHLKELPYLEMCVKESIRILPSVWVFMKQPTEDAVVGGFKIPKGSPVIISPYVTQHDARWFPSPETFDPERFSKVRAKAIPNGAYVPFSGGQRICIGKAFAMMEAQLVVGSLLQRVKPQLAPDYKIAMKAELSNHPEGGLPVDVALRA